MIVGRSPEKTARVAAGIGARGLVADYTCLDDVRRVAADILRSVDRIDVLLNNAGGAFDPRHTTPDGYEPNFQVNHLAPFLLTMLLREPLRRAPATSRVINTSSLVHLIASKRFGQLGRIPKPPHVPLRSYASSKMMNILSAVALTDRWSQEGVVAAAVHPGIVATNFGRESVIIRAAYETPVRHLVSINAEQGAAPLIALAADKPVGEVAGQYFHRYRPGFALRPYAVDHERADRLWQESCRLIGHEG